jgi:hypothetical protein
MLGIALRLIVFALGILGPIEREAITYWPVGKVNTID